MAHVDRLKKEGIIAHDADLSEHDHKVINSLTDDEVSALVSIKKKITPEFEKKHLARKEGAPSSVGIVF